MTARISLRSAATLLATGLLVAACGSNGTTPQVADASVHDSGYGGSYDDGSNDGAQGTVDSTVDAVVEDAAADSGGDDGGDALAEAGGDGGTACAPGTTQCQANGIQVCGPAGTWGTAMDCGDEA